MDKNLLLEGTPWWVNFQFTSLNLASPVELVRPKFTTTIDTNIDGVKIKDNNRLIILGIAYNFHTAANSGIDLYWQYSDGSPQKSQIVNAVCGTANANVFNGYETFIPGVAGRIISSTAYAPASLYLAAVGTQPTLGHIKVWGIHVDAAWRVGKLFDKTVGGTAATLNFNTATTLN